MAVAEVCTNDVRDDDNGAPTLLEVKASQLEMARAAVAIIV